MLLELLIPLQIILFPKVHQDVRTPRRNQRLHILRVRHIHLTQRVRQMLVRAPQRSHELFIDHHPRRPCIQRQVRRQPCQHRKRIVWIARRLRSHIQQHPTSIHQSDLRPLPHKRHRRPLPDLHPYAIRQQPHHRRMFNPRQPFQICLAFRKRRPKNIPLQVRSKHAQHLVARQMLRTIDPNIVGSRKHK